MSEVQNPNNAPSVNSTEHKDNVQRPTPNAQRPTFNVQRNTICALATPAGGAIGVVRLSGPDAIAIADSVFSRNISAAKANTLHYGEIRDSSGHTVDQVVVSIWRAPHSYTGEDAVEISCHGSAIVLQHVLATLIEAGARQAEPGEYTMRAYMNGKMDLSQAEAVADIVAASSEASYRVALNQLKGSFRSRLDMLREKLQKMTALLELELDFSDHEELEFADRTELQQLAADIDSEVSRLAASFKTGQALKEGIPIAIVGKTNVGKSTLLNALLGERRALVSDVHGTTRDAIEDVASINGIAFRFIDTAGIRVTDDSVERMGIELSYEKMEHAAIVLWVVDAVPTAAEVDDMRRRTSTAKLIVVANKQDLHPEPLRLDADIPVVGISARNGDNIDSLKELIVRLSGVPDISENSVIVTSARHYNCLVQAHRDLALVADAMSQQLSADLVAEYLRSVIADLNAITGNAITPQSTLNEIFSHFCIGK